MKFDATADPSIIALIIIYPLIIRYKKSNYNTDKNILLLLLLLLSISRNNKNYFCCLVSFLAFLELSFDFVLVSSVFAIGFNCSMFSE
jgi:predicted membrane protein